MKKILVTGGAGFIGSNFIRYILRNKKYSIVNLDCLTYAGNLENLSDVAKHKNYKFIRGDITDKKLIDNLFSREKFYGVINFAAETHVDRSIKNSQSFVKTNILGTHTLLDASKKYKVKKFHQISTDEVYGDLGENSRDFFTEETPLNPNCPYAATKAAADLLVESYHRTYSMWTVITRCSNNYGPYQFPEKLIPFFFFRASKNLSLPVYGDGKNIRDWLYVLDHVTAILLVFEQSKAGEIWNIGGHNEKNNLEIAKKILARVPHSTSKIKFVPDRLSHDKRYAMDANKISRNLGWKPSYDFKKALPETIAWYVHHSSWVKKCRDKALLKKFNTLPA